MSKKLEISTLPGDLNGQLPRTYLAAKVGGETHNTVHVGNAFVPV